MQLNKFNIEVFAARNYINEACLSREEFEEDFQRSELARKMTRKIIRGASVNIRLLCNHILCFTNNFQIEAAKQILLFEATEEEKQVLKTVLNYFNFVGENEMTDTRFHLETAKLLKEMDR